MSKIFNLNFNIDYINKQIHLLSVLLERNHNASLELQSRTKHMNETNTTIEETIKVIEQIESLKSEIFGIYPQLGIKLENFNPIDFELVQCPEIRIKNNLNVLINQTDLIKHRNVEIIKVLKELLVPLETKKPVEDAINNIMIYNEITQSLKDNLEKNIYTMMSNAVVREKLQSYKKYPRKVVKKYEDELVSGNMSPAQFKKKCKNIANSRAKKKNRKNKNNNSD